MSGRVRWRPFTDEPRCGRMLCVGPLRVGDVVPDGDGWAATVYGTDARETRGRRSDAKRWLLARAAGLAEVPRRVRVGPRGGSWSYVRRDAHTVWPPPGWHEVEEYIGDDGEVGVVLCERDRRRRGRGTSGPTARP